MTKDHDSRRTHPNAFSAHLPPERDPQLVMAANRTMLAIERTYAAWVRTGLAALASGVATCEFVDEAVPASIADAMASLLIVFSAFCFIAAVWRELGGFGGTAWTDLRGVAPAVLIAANSVMLLISVTALVGIWIADN
ncbi:DUF202 domain-containing protein [Sphingomonas sp. PB4P5]|uniref:DUF202 domain-containing protein n=1 Tax=Parasphingomonas puruogangriensis TaxID=3096155 RepID=UPI002FCCA0D7